MNEVAMNMQTPAIAMSESAAKLRGRFKRQLDSMITEASP